MLSIENLSVKFTDKTLLSGINLDFQQGDYLCIIGANGAGKTTLLKTLMGIIKPSSGQVFLHQQNLFTLGQKQLAKQVSYVAQAHNHVLHFKVDEFIKMARYPYHSGFSDWSKTDQTAFEHAISVTNTETFLSRQITSLSGGERQRVMIAAALCQQTPILLLDEPSSYLDPHHQVEVHQLIQILNQQYNISIIEVTHDLNHACQRSKHILALKQGRCLWYGAATALLESTELEQVYDQRFVFTKHPQTGAKIALASEVRGRTL
jgi:ABC-type cobalamin/Fe3+-siderophores transport system ATPase subunit